MSRREKAKRVKSQVESGAKIPVAYAATLGQAAAMAGVPVELVQHARNVLGWDCFDAAGRTNVTELKALLAGVPELVQKFSQPNEEDLYLREKREFLAERRKRLSGESIPLFEVKRDCQKSVLAAKERLLSSKHAIVAACASDLKLDADQQNKLREIVEHEHLQVMLTMQRGEWFK